MASQQLLHITFARQDEAWVERALIPALGLAEGQYWTRAEDNPGDPVLDELERAVLSCRYTLLVASSAASVDTWTQFTARLAQHLGVEQSKPRLLLVTRDFAPGSDRARELLPLHQRCLVCFDCSDADRTAAALAALAAQLALSTTDTPPAECPYPGLRTFGAGDPATCFPRTDLFFGRDAEARDVIDRLRDARRVLLIGPSGCGKSSLIRARVLPALGQGTDAVPFVLARPGQKPADALRQALDQLDPQLGPAIDASLAATDEPAALTALEAAGNRPRLVCLDQLEEVFLDPADDSGQRARFFALLAALGCVPGMSLLLGMRADFYGDLMRSPAWDAFKDHRVELAPLRGAALRRVITRPAELAGVHVEADLVERLVREADQDRAAEALPLLQVALAQLWTLREWRYLSLASYARLADGQRHGLDAVLTRHADASIAALEPPAQVLARRVLIDLVHLGEGRPDTRRRRTRSELRRAGDDDQQLSQVLRHLSERRLIAISAEASVMAAIDTVALPAPRATTTVEASSTCGDIVERNVDLAHDTLITGWPALAGWISERRDKLRTQRRLEARAVGGMLDATELPEFLGWLAWIDTPAGQALGASDALRALVRRSVVARRFRRRAFGAGLLVAIGFAAVFGLQTFQLRDEKTKTQRSISKAASAAQLIVFEIDIKLETLAGASRIRETLLPRARQLLAELREIGNLSEVDQRTAMAGRMAEADLLLERGHLAEAQKLYQAVLDDAHRRAAADPSNSAWQHDLSVAYERLGDVAISAGKLDDARTWFDKALAVRHKLAAADPSNSAWQRDLSLSYDRLGDVAVSAGKLDDARTWFDKALAVAQNLAAADPSNTTWQRDLSLSYDRLGDVAISAGKLDDARTWFDKALAVAQNLAAADPSNTTWQRDLSVSYNKLGDVAVSAGKLDDTRTWFDKALAVAQNLAAADPSNTTWQRDLSVSYNKLGDVAVSAGKLDDARTWFDKALAVRHKLTDADPSNSDWQRDLSASYDRLGDVAVSAGKLDDARTWFDKALAVRHKLATADPGNSAWQRDLSLSYDRLGDVAVSAGKLDDARTWFDKALAVRHKLTDADPSNSDWQRDLSASYEKLGDVAVSAGKLDNARTWFDKALAVTRKLATTDPSNSQWQRDLCTSLTMNASVARNPADATKHLAEARVIYDRLKAHALFRGDTQFAELGTTLVRLARAPSRP